MSGQVVLFWLVVYLLFAAPWCLVFAKAGKRWWVALLPVINLLVVMRIAGRPGWWVLLLLVPLVGIGVWTVVCLDVSERFGHGIPVTIGLVFLPFVFAVWLGAGPDAYVRQPVAAAASEPASAEPASAEPETAEPETAEPETAEQDSGEQDSGGQDSGGQDSGTDQRIGAGE